MTRGKQTSKNAKSFGDENFDNSFNDEDRRQLKEINETMKILVEEI